AIVRTESSENPYAIAIVKGPKLKRQPRTREEAVKLIHFLDSIGANYSVGIGQINKVNFSKYKVDGVSLLDPCLNLRIAQKVLQECHQVSGDIDKTLSCYYSGNFVRGFKKDFRGTSYVERIYKNAYRGPFIPELKKSFKERRVVSVKPDKKLKAIEAKAVDKQRSIVKQDCDYTVDFCSI
ncbi:MAG: lytic transglycosylase domain-containing protein, partial [Neisseriaceae bacterium]